MTNKGLQDIITDHFEAVRSQIMDNYHRSGMKASGKFERETFVTATSTIASINVKLVGAPHSKFVDGGRGATGEGAVKGTPNLAEIIKIWAANKGIQVNAYAVAKKIHKQGWKPRALQTIGKPVISSVVNELEWRKKLVNELSKYSVKSTNEFILTPWLALLK